MSSALVALAAVAASHEMRQAELIDYGWMGACHVVLCFVHLVRFRKHRILYTRAHVAHNHEYRECNDTCHADHYTRHLRTPWAWMWVLLLAYVALHMMYVCTHDDSDDDDDPYGYLETATDTAAAAACARGAAIGPVARCGCDRHLLDRGVQ